MGGRRATMEPWQQLSGANRRALASHFKPSGRHLHCEYRIMIKSGEYRWVLDHGVAVRNKAGRAVANVSGLANETNLGRRA